MIKAVEITVSTIKIIYILLIAFLTWLATQFLTKSFVVAISAGTPKGKRLKTLTSLVKAAISTLIWVVAAFMILREIGFDITPLLASAGILGLAVGFGAQTLVKDVISGAFILMENQFSEGDEVEISGKKGNVEKMTLRTVKLRDKDGSVHIIPNGSIALVTNFSKTR
ncbi:MAG: mechanosensitive ion channel domain-containing protein [Candidatus Woykebacteria bacterium]